MRFDLRVDNDAKPECIFSGKKGEHPESAACRPAPANRDDDRLTWS